MLRKAIIVATIVVLAAIVIGTLGWVTRKQNRERDRECESTMELFRRPKDSKPLAGDPRDLLGN